MLYDGDMACLECQFALMITNYSNLYLRQMQVTCSATCCDSFLSFSRSIQSTLYCQSECFTATTTFLQILSGEFYTVSEGSVHFYFLLVCGTKIFKACASHAHTFSPGWLRSYCQQTLGAFHSTWGRGVEPGLKICPLPYNHAFWQTRLQLKNCILRNN